MLSFLSCFRETQHSKYFLLLACFFTLFDAGVVRQQTAAADEGTPADSSSAKAQQLASFIRRGPLQSSAEQIDQLIKVLAVEQSPDDSEEYDGVQTIVDLTHIHYRKDGTVTTDQWVLRLVPNRRAASDAAEVTAEWTPWRMPQPTLQARVLNPDGSVIESDAAQAFEQSANSGADSVHTDRRQLTLLLDGVGRDSIIESSVHTETRPVLGDAALRANSLLGLDPIGASVIRISADPGMTPEIRSIGPEVDKLSLTTTNDSERPEDVFVVYNTSSIFEAYESNTGPDRVSYPLVVSCLPGNWESLASQYSAAVDRALSDGAETVRKLGATATDEVRNGETIDKVQWAHSRIRKLVRYTGVEFGEHSIFPVSPDVLVHRRFGDCKDQATLMVGLLRELGVTAHVALLKAGTGIDVVPDLPALNGFNHAIAYVDDLNLWVDLTAEGYPADILPPTDRLRRSLICRAKGGKLLTTPASNAGSERRVQIHRNWLTFSGGGRREVVIHDEGDAAIELRFGYEESSRAEAVERWEQHFESLLTVPAVSSLKICDVDETNYRVHAWSAPLQLLDRESATSTIRWDVSSIVGYLPSAFQTVQFGDEPPERTLPLVLSSGFEAIFADEFLYPATMKLGQLPEGWTETFGPVELKVEYRRVPAAELNHLLLEDLPARELVRKATPESPARRSARDQALAVRATLKLSAGTMSVADFNRCQSFLNALQDEDPRFVGHTTLDWSTVQHFAVDANARNFAATLDEARTYQALEEPFIGLMLELSSHGLAEFAREKVSSLESRPDQLLGNHWLADIRAETIEDDDGQIRPDADFKTWRSQFEGRPQDPVLWPEYLKVLTITDNALRSEDPDVLKKSFELCVELIDRPEFDALDFEQRWDIEREFLRAGLTLRRDDEVATRVDRIGTVPEVRVIRLLLTPDQSSVESLVTARQSDAETLTSAWEYLINAGRDDLVALLAELAAKNRILLPVDITPESDGDTADAKPDSVRAVREAVIAWLSHDRDRLTAMSLPPGTPDFASGLKRYEPLPSRLWFETSPRDRTRTFIRTAVDIVPAEVKPVGQYAQSVTLKGLSTRWLPNPGDAQDEFSLLTVKDLQTGDWKVALWDRHVDSYLRQLLQAGELESAVAIIDHIVPPARGFLGLFSDAPPLSPMHKFWHASRLLPAVDRVELYSLLLTAVNTLDCEKLDQRLKQRDFSLSKRQQLLLNETREGVLMAAGKYEEVYQSMLDRIGETTNPVVVGDLLDLLMLDRARSGSLAADDRWKTALSDFFETSPARHSMMAKYLLLTDQQEEAIQKMYDRLRIEKSFDAANTYLWHSLLLDCTRDEINARLRHVKAALDSDFVPYVEAAYAHTLACANSRAGKPWEALLQWESVYDSEFLQVTSGPLTQALILEALDFNDDARRYFKRTIELDPKSQSARIAGLGLKRLGESTSAPSPKQASP